LCQPGVVDLAMQVCWDMVLLLALFSKDSGAPLDVQAFWVLLLI
jgi:hypothetical protein